MTSRRQRLHERLASWRSTARQLGVFTTGLYVVHRLLEWASRGRARIVPYEFYAQPIAAGNIKVRPDPDTAIQTVDPDSHLLNSFPRSHQVIDSRFAAGARCHAAHIKGAFAGHIWIASGHWDEDEVRCRYELPEPTCVWDFDVYVEAEYRLGRTLARLWQAVNGSLATQGVEWSYSRISRFNPGSIGAHKRLGAVRVARAVFIAIGKLQVALLSLPPFIHIGASRPVAIRLPLPRRR